MSTGDLKAATYGIHNRDATICIRALVSPIHPDADSGAVIGPGQTIPFRDGSNGITKVVVWAESGTPVCDGFVQVLL